MKLLPKKAVLITDSSRRNRLLWIGMLALCAIAAAAVIHRIVALAFPLPNLPAPVAAMDAAFAKKPVLTLVHIIPALVFVTLVPFQFSARLRGRYPSVHRLTGRILMILAGIIGVSALLLLRCMPDPVQIRNANLTFAVANTSHLDSASMLRITRWSSLPGFEKGV